MSYKKIPRQQEARGILPKNYTHFFYGLLFLKFYLKIRSLISINNAKFCLFCYFFFYSLVYGCLYLLAGEKNYYQRAIKITDFKLLPSL